MSSRKRKKFNSDETYKKYTVGLIGGGSATFTEKPSKEMMYAVNAMVELAKKNLPNKKSNNS